STDKDKKNRPPRWQAILIAACCLLSAALILPLKLESDRRAPIYRELAAARQAGTQEQAGTAPVAVPDTTGDPTALPALPDTLPPAAPDTISWGEVRPATLAGQEDGYMAGQYDASLGQHRATYDESNTFATEAGRQAYASGYAEGYERGYAEAAPPPQPAGTGDEEDGEPGED
ncbi:MAG: hypothetical protein IJ729_00935, partial [Alloprevotella sp.]|nr:hypothetical protein [Alloprevotella sp.]